MATGPYLNIANASGQTVLAWTDSAGLVQTSVADKRCLELGMENAQRSRRPVKYQHRRNYEGFYQAANGQSIWYESMTEYIALMEMDHVDQITRVSSQPFCILFGEGGRHYPDFFALHESGRQWLYDVRPAELIDERATRQFDMTKSVCEKIGWGYKILHGVNGIQRYNLEWLAAYRHPYVRPNIQLAAQILDAVNGGKMLAELSETVDWELPVRVLPGIYHLLWTRQLTFDDSVPLSWGTMIRRNTNG